LAGFIYEFSRVVTKNPILTIITVTKNCSSTISKTLESISEIKSNDIEYIVVDGISKDGTLEKLKEYSPVIDLLISESDDGIYDAMNKGVSLASGEYILFLNGDDCIFCEDFELIIKSLKQRTADIYCSQTLAFDANGQSNVLVANKWLLPFYNSIPHPSSFVSRTLLTLYPFRKDLRIAADYDLFLKLFIMRREFKAINIISSMHTRGGASGNVGLSLSEIRLIRREQLGQLYYLFDTLHWLYRRLKLLLIWRQN
jgi:glycosyltransferase involved in cell wall biosynthesis